MKILKRMLAVIFIVCMSIAIVIGAINLAVITEARKYILDSDKLMETDAIIVLGAYVFPSGEPCMMLKDRLDTGYDMVNRGVSGKVILSGDNGRKDYDEVNGMKNYMLNLGIREEDIFLDHAGFSTYETMYRAKDIFLVDSAVISTQEFHLTRAVYIARKMGIEAYGVKADRRNYPKGELMYYEIREVLARVKDFMQVNILKSQPTFRGDKIPITGDGRITFD